MYNTAILIIVQYFYPYVVILKSERAVALLTILPSLTIHKTMLTEGYEHGRISFLWNYFFNFRGPAGWR